MLTEKNKRVYEKLADRGIENHLFYAVTTLLYVKPMRHFFIDLHFSEEEKEKLKPLKDKPCVVTGYHTLTTDPPLVSEVVYDLIGKSHGLVDRREFTRHRKLYSFLEEVPFNTSYNGDLWSKRQFEEDYRWSFGKLKYWLTERKEPVMVFNDGDTASHTKIMQEKGLEILELKDKPNSGIPAKLAIETNVPIVVFASYVDSEIQKELYTWKRNQSWKYLISHRRIPFFLKVADIITPDKFEGVGKLKKKIRDKQIEAQNELKKACGK